MQHCFLQVSTGFQKSSLYFTDTVKNGRDLSRALLLILNLLSLESLWPGNQGVGVALGWLRLWGACVINKWSEHQSGDQKHLFWIMMLKKATEAQLCEAKAVCAGCCPVWSGQLVMSSTFSGISTSGALVGHQRHFKDKPVLWVGKSAWWWLAHSSSVCDFQSQTGAAVFLLPFAWFCAFFPWWLLWPVLKSYLVPVRSRDGHLFCWKPGVGCLYTS